MMTRHAYGGLVWIDLESPTNAELRRIIEEFGILPHTADELAMRSARQRAERYSSYLFFVMRFPALRHSHEQRQQEVDFIVGQRFFITVHYETVDALHKFAKVFDVHATLATEPVGNHAGYLFFSALRKLYQSIDHELEYLEKQLSKIEEDIFAGREVHMVADISNVARSLLNLRQTIEPHREILRELEENGAAFFGDDFVPFLRSLTREYFRAHNHVMRTTDALHELRETNNSLLSTKQNETLKIYTIMAFFTFPLALIATVLSIHSTYNPVLGRTYDFWIIVGILLITLIAMVAYFKRKEWL